MKLKTSSKLTTSAADLWIVVSGSQKHAGLEREVPSDRIHPRIGNGYAFKAQFAMRPDKKSEPTEGEIVEWKEYERHPSLPVS